MKICKNCGKGHPQRPSEAKKNELGWWWDCTCGSTLFEADPEFQKILKKRKDSK